MIDGRIIAEPADVAELLKVCRARREQLGVTNEMIDYAGELNGHCGKYLASPVAKNLGIETLGRLLRAIGLRMIIVEDPEQTARLLDLRSRPCRVRHARSASEQSARNV